MDKSEFIEMVRRLEEKHGERLRFKCSPELGNYLDKLGIDPEFMKSEAAKISESMRGELDE